MHFDIPYPWFSYQVHDVPYSKQSYPEKIVHTGHEARGSEENVGGPRSLLMNASGKLTVALKDVEKEIGTLGLLTFVCYQVPGK